MNYSYILKNKKTALLLISLIMVISNISSCGIGLKMSPEELLSYSGRKKLPTQADFPDDGAVILYENSQNNFYLDSNWDVNITESFHRAILYFSDKAEDWTTISIYLDKDITLSVFHARTIKPNGEIIELSDKDLHPTQLKEDYVDFSDDKSVKFTFSGVEPNSILEYSVIRHFRSAFYSGDLWKIQKKIPTLYSRYSVEIPNIFRQYYDWTYFSENFKIGTPQYYENLLTEKSQKNASNIYYWEVKDIPPLKYEPDMPPYRDVAKYVRLDLLYDNWNEWSNHYWERIKKYFDVQDKPQFKKLAEQITESAQTTEEKIRKIFEYTQKNYRYVAINIGESGIIPHEPEKILKNQYGDCKDMTVINAALLNSLGIETHPALVKTKDSGTTHTNIPSYSAFNHMIDYVKSDNGKEYWLDATGSSCPLGEVYGSIEGVKALVIYNDGKSEFKQIPSSKYRDNSLIRTVDITINDDGSISGKAELEFKGNRNLSFRSIFRNASTTDMHKAIESYVNANTANIHIQKLEYDDPSVIADTFNLKFEFTREKFGSAAGQLLIFKPGIFTLADELDRYRDEDRNYPLMFDSPYLISDVVNIYYDPEKFEIESKGNRYVKNEKFAVFTVTPSMSEEGTIHYKRDYVLSNTSIPANKYRSFRDIQKEIALANDDNIVLKRK